MEKYFIYIAAMLLLILGAVDLGRNYVLRNNTDYTIGEVVSIWQPNPEAVKKGNSKWAYFSYYVDGKKYLSKNRIQVSMSTKIGEKIKIKYDKRNPEKLYSFSVKRGFILLAVSLVLFAVGKFELF